MHYCLNSAEISDLVRFVETGVVTEDINLMAHITQAQMWQERLVCLTLLFARVLEKNRDEVGKPERMLKALFSVNEEMYLDVQECGADLVDYILRNVRDSKSPFEESLIELQNGYSEHRYDKTLRG